MSKNTGTLGEGGSQNTFYLGHFLNLQFSIVTNVFQTDREVTSVNFRSKNFEVMTAGKNGIWKIYDICGSSQNPVSTQYDLGGQLRLQGHTGSVSYCLSYVNGANALYTWKGQGRPQKR